MLKKFRGATNEVTFEFDTTKPIVVIFGENGTGKSTIVDAIDFVCNEELGSLKERSFGAKHLHVASLGSLPAELSVTLAYADQEWHAALNRQSPRTTGHVPRLAAHILRRGSVLRLVEAIPSKRYEAIGHFIALPAIESAENELRKAIKTAAHRTDEALAAQTQAENLLRRLWESEGAPNADAFTWAEGQMYIDEAENKRAVGSLESIPNQLKRAADAQTYLTNGADEHATAAAHFAQLEAQLIAAGRERDGGDDLLLLDLLRQAARFAANVAAPTNLAACPLCEQAIDAQSFTARLNERLAAMNSLVVLREAVERERMATGRAADALAPVRRNFINTVAHLAPLIEESHAATTFALDWNDFAHIVDNAQVNASADAASPEALGEALKLFATVEARRDALQTEYEGKRAALNQLKSVRVYLTEIAERRGVAAEADRQKSALAAMLEIVERERKGFVEETLQRITVGVEELYEKMHPGEGIGRCRFYLKPDAHASLEFDGTFGGRENLPPSAYFSESHLDTLGICVFLALAKLDAAPDRILVLDDVITSVDDVHTERFINLLHDEAEHFNHIIITTHYRMWLERYRHHQSAYKDVNLIELQRWTLPKGIRHAKTRLAIDESREAMAREPLDRQAAAGKSGVLLESVLDFLALRYRGRVPRQTEPRYTIGDLLNAVDKELKKRLRVERIIARCSTGAEALIRHHQAPSKVNLDELARAKSSGARNGGAARGARRNRRSHMDSQHDRRAFQLAGRKRHGKRHRTLRRCDAASGHLARLRSLWRDAIVQQNGQLLDMPLPPHAAPPRASAVVRSSRRLNRAAQAASRS